MPVTLLFLAEGITKRTRVRRNESLINILKPGQ